MRDVIDKVAQYNVYFTLDMKSAYQQVELSADQQIFIDFEAEGGLYQWKRIYFGLTNAVPCFQRIVDEIIEASGCNGTFAYLDKITGCGKTQEEHDADLKKFLSAARKHNLTLNHSKCIYSTTSIKFLGYEITNSSLKPDPNRIKPLLELHLPYNNRTLKHVLGLFAYYAQWIKQYSDKVKPLIENTHFPLDDVALQAFEILKNESDEVSLGIIDNSAPFVVETDASDVELSASPSQWGRPVAFFPRNLTKVERNQSSVEKEAPAIVEAIRKWNHCLLGRKFTLITDQQSVRYMYDTGSKRGKI